MEEDYSRFYKPKVEDVDGYSAADPETKRMMKKSETLLNYLSREKKSSFME